MYSNVLFLLLLIKIIGICHSLKYDLIISHIETKFLNETYIEHLDFFMSRSGRDQPYSATLNLTYVDENCPNQSSIVIEAWEKMTIGYRKSMTMYNETMCNWIKSDPVFYPMVKKHSNLPAQCPLPKTITVKEVYIHTELLPTFLPWQDFQMVFSLYITKSMEMIMSVGMNFNSRPITKGKRTQDKN